MRQRESRDGHVPGALDELPKPVVVALLRAPRGRHGMMIGGSPAPLNSSRRLRAVRRRETVRRSDGNSRRKVQNVRGDSSAFLSGIEVIVLTRQNRFQETRTPITVSPK